MINKVCDSQGWQLDMQLVGKLALTATAALILALAFRFYKSRVHERSGAADGGGGGHSGYQDVAGGDHLNDETNQLRRRGVRRNLHGDVTSSAGSQRPAGDPLTTQESEGGPIGGYQTPDVISAGQSDLNNQSPETGDIALSGHECHRESHQGLGCSGREVCNGNGTIRDNGGSGVVQPGKDSGKDISVGTIRDNEVVGAVQSVKDSGNNISFGTIRDNADSKSLPIDSAKDIHDGKGSGTIRDNADLGTVQSLKDSGKGISVGTIRDNEDLGTVQSLKDSGKGISVGTIRDNSDSKSLPIDSAKDGKGVGTIRDNASSGTVQSLKDSSKDISFGTIRDNGDLGAVQSVKDSGKDISDVKAIGAIRDNGNCENTQILNESGKEICKEKGIGTISDNAGSGAVQPLKDSDNSISVQTIVGAIRDNSDLKSVNLPIDSAKDIHDGKGHGAIRDNADLGTVQSLNASSKDISVGTIRDNVDSKSLPIDSAKDEKGSGTIRDNANSGAVQPVNDSGKDISEQKGIGTIKANVNAGNIQPLRESGKDICEESRIGTIKANVNLGTIQPLNDSGKDIFVGENSCKDTCDEKGFGTTWDNAHSDTVQPLKYIAKDISNVKAVGTIKDNSNCESGKEICDEKGSGTIRDNADPGTVQSLKDSGKDISDVKEAGTIKGNANCESGKKICDGKGSGTIRDNVDSGTVQTLNDSGKDISDVKGIGTIKANAKCGNIQSLQGFVKDICDEFGIGTIRDNSDSENIQLPNDSGNDICDGKGIGATKDNTSSGIIQTVTESIRPCKEKGIGTIGDNSDSENLRINNLKDTGDGKVEKTTVDHVDSGDLQPVRESGKDPIDETENGTIWNNHRPEVTTANVDSGSLIQDLQSSSGISLALNENHKTMQEVHRFSSVSRVVVEENIIGERQVEESRTSPRSAGLRGKVYEYHIESTSETVSPEKHFKFRASVSPSKCPQAGQQDNQEVKVGQGQDHGGVLGPKLGQFSADLFTVSQESLEAKGNSTPSGLISPLRSLAPKGALNTKPSKGNSVFHVSLSPESTFDVYLGLENCLEVLSLAKKHDLDVLKTAAYKVMSDNYLDVLQNPSVYGRLHAAERDLILEKRMRGRRYVVVADVDTMGYSVPGDSTLSYYDSDRDSWHLLCPMPPEAVSRACSMATMFNYIFIVLGCQGLEREMKPSQRVVCYNPVTGQWQDICPLNEARPHCKLVELDGYLYAIGGECLHTVERYDPRQNRWSYVAPLPNDTFAVAHMATSYDDEIYVTGGTIRYLLLRYQRRDNTWKSSVITGSKDRTTELVAANNFLYRFDVNRSVGISVHRCSVRARIWYECATYAMPYPLPFQCAVVDNNIYLISRNFHLRFLTDDISPRFMEDNLKTLPCPKGLLSPLVLVLPGVDSQ